MSYADGSSVSKLDRVADELGTALCDEVVDAVLVVLHSAIDFARFMQIAYKRGWDCRIDICLADSIEDSLVQTAARHGRVVVKVVTFDDVAEHINELAGGPSRAARIDGEDSSEELTDVSAVPRPPDALHWRTMVLVHTREKDTPRHVIERCVLPAQEADAFCRTVYCGWPGDDADDADADAEK
jgi:hypothetical protein